MSVNKEASGRRSIQVEVEVPGTPEEVWQAIASGPGVSSWFVPTEFELSDGQPVAVRMNFGPGMAVRSPVTAWDPPRMFAAQGEGWGGSPPIATEWSVEARAGGVCLVRVVNMPGPKFIVTATGLPSRSSNAAGTNQDEMPGPVAMACQTSSGVPGTSTSTWIERRPEASFFTLMMAPWEGTSSAGGAP